MPEIQHNGKLNQVLIDLGRSLLQYVGEAWPWTSPGHDADRAALDQLVARQKEQVARLTDLLLERGWQIDFGQYPVEYTDLHYVALDYLLGQLLVNEEGLVVELEEAIHTCIDDPEAVQLLEHILAEERETLRRLREFAESRTATAATKF